MAFRGYQESIYNAVISKKNWGIIKKEINNIINLIKRRLRYEICFRN